VLVRTLLLVTDTNWSSISHYFAERVENWVTFSLFTVVFLSLMQSGGGERLLNHRPTSPETWRVSGQHVCRRQHGSSLKYVWRSETCRFRRKTVQNGHKADQGRSRLPIFVPIESLYATSYKWIIQTCIVSCIVFEISRIVDQIGRPDGWTCELTGVKLSRNARVTQS